MVRQRIAEVFGEVDDQIVRALGIGARQRPIVVSVLKRKCGDTRARSASSSAW